MVYRGARSAAKALVVSSQEQAKTKPEIRFIIDSQVILDKLYRLWLRKPVADKSHPEIIDRHCKPLIRRTLWGDVLDIPRFPSLRLGLIVLIASAQEAKAGIQGRLIFKPRFEFGEPRSGGFWFAER